MHSQADNNKLECPCKPIALQACLIIYCWSLRYVKLCYFMCMPFVLKRTTLIYLEANQRYIHLFHLSGSASGCCMLLLVLPFHSRMQRQDSRFWERNLVCVVLSQIRQGNILSVLNEMHFPDRIRTEKCLYDLYKPYGSSNCISPSLR